MSRKILEGVVVSDKMEKTITVMVINRFANNMFKRLQINRKKYAVHDEKNTAKIGDRVKIVEGRPYSKNKRFRLLEIVKQG